MIKLSILRMLRASRIMAVLLMSMCLVTAFLALGPLYLQALAISDFDQRIETANQATLSTTVRNDVRLSESVPQIITDRLGEFIGAQRGYATTGAFNCGFIYNPDAPDNIGNPSQTIECYRPYTYENIQDLFTVVEGRFPQDGAGEIIEAVITRRAADEKEHSLGQRYIIGGSPQSAVTVELVGIVEPLLPPDTPFWLQQTILDTTQTFFTPVDSRLDISLAVTLQGFDTLLPVVGDPTYVREFEYRPETLDALNANQVVAATEATLDDLRQIHPEITLSARLLDLVAQHQRGIDDARGPVTILSFLVLVLMFYNIVATASLILEQQSQEWAMLASRGGSDSQLVFVQFITNFVLGGVAAAVGPFLSYAIMLILATVGPYAAVIDGSRLGTVPLQSVLMSLIAAALMVIVLTIPAWVYASKSLQELKASIARAPKAPLWARYYLDLIILLAGGAFLLRLFSLSTESSISDLLTDPSLLIDAFAQQSSSVLFSDAFNLAGPVLLLLGASMLWLRIFPLFIRLLGSLLAGGDGLTVRLAFWNVERDPGHYAQLVLLLIGTLALGTASLALSETRTEGGWDASLAEVGADAALTIDPLTYDPSTQWDTLPSVVDAVPLIRILTDVNNDSALIGLDLADIDSDSLQHIAEPFTLLEDTNLTLPGQPLPPDTTRLSLDVYARAPQEAGTIDTRISFIVEDATGLRSTIPLESDESTQAETFITYTADVPLFGTPPYRLVQLRLESEHDQVDEFEHVIYLDNLVAYTSDDNPTIINSFDPDTISNWRWGVGSRFGQVLESTALDNDIDIVTEGDHSLRILHLMRASGGAQSRFVPVNLTYNDIDLPPIPVVVSQSFANAEGLSSRFRRPLQVGESLTTSINIPTIQTSTSREEFSYEIVGIVENTYPSFVNNERLIFADYDTLRYRLNTYTVTSEFANLIYDYNTVWFDLEDDIPPQSFIDAVRSVDGYIDDAYAWNRFLEVQRDPLTNAVTGMLFAGFWVSLFLSLMDFGFYMAVTIRRRAMAFATLQAIGWNERNLLNLLLVEQVAFITPAIAIGMLFGILLASLILPFLSLIGGLQLQIPIAEIALLIAILVLTFAAILRIAAIVLRRLNLNRVMRFGE